MPSPDPLAALLEALQFSPENVPLRQHLAEALLAAGRGDEAETQYREALSLAPANIDLKLGLARAFVAQKKDSAALVILEDAVKGRDVPAQIHLLYAQVLLRRGEVPLAVAQYKLAVEIDPDAEDKEFAQRLGIGPAYEDSDVVEGRLRVGREEGGKPLKDKVERPKINFSEIGGMEQLKDEIRIKIIHPLSHPELYEAYGKKVGGGILMYGPPGCGKTHLARATAGEIKAGFINVGINDVLDMWMGSSERNLHELFQQAREAAPCVLFFDEVDALGSRRSDMRMSSGRHLINQFLAELDGIGASNEGVLVLAATNSPWHIDPAFRRPGRFDRILFVPPPDATARVGILQILLRGKPMAQIDYNLLAKKTEHFSGADLKGVIEQAIESKLREAMKAGAAQPLTTADLVTAAATLRPTTKEWFSTAKNHALYANEGGLYDDILKYMRLT